MKIFKDDNLDIKTQPLSVQESQRLWSGIYQRLNEPRPQVFPAGVWLWQRRAYLPLAVLVLLLAGSFTTVVLAAQAKPGDALFRVKLAYEDLQIQLAVSPAKKSELAVQFSQERVKEVKAVLAENSVAAVIVPVTLESQPGNTTTPTSTIKLAVPKNSAQHLDKNHHALISSLDYLNKAKEKLEKSASPQATEEIDSLVDQLSDRAEDYVGSLEKIKSQVPDNQEINDRIDRSEKELKEKFQLDKRSSEQNQKNLPKGRDNNAENENRSNHD